MKMLLLPRDLPHKKWHFTKDDMYLPNGIRKKIPLFVIEIN